RPKRRCSPHSKAPPTAFPFFHNRHVRKSETNRPGAFGVRRASPLWFSFSLPWAEPSQHPHAADRGRAALPRERQRRRHPLPRRRRDAETQIPLAAGAQARHARAVLDEQRRVHLTPHAGDRLHVPQWITALGLKPCSHL